MHIAVWANLFTNPKLTARGLVVHVRELIAPNLCAMLCLSGCALSHAQWMTRVAQPQAKAREAAGLVRNLSTAAARITKNQGAVQQEAAQTLEVDCGTLTAGLDAVANSQDPQEYAAAVLSICDQDKKDAAARIGQVMLRLANQLRTDPPMNATQTEIHQLQNRLDDVGEQLINTPSACERLSEATAEAKIQEQEREQARENLSAALVVTGAALIQASQPIVVVPPVQNNYYYDISPPEPQPPPTIGPTSPEY